MSNFYEESLDDINESIHSCIYDVNHEKHDKFTSEAPKMCVYTLKKSIWMELGMLFMDQYVLKTMQGPHHKSFLAQGG